MLFVRKACVLTAMTLAVMSVGGGRGAFGDTVVMEDGDKLTGKIEKVTADTVEMATKHAGHVTIQKSAVKSMWSEEEVSVVNAAGETRQVFLAPAKDGTSWKETAAVAPQPTVGPVVMKAAEPAPPVLNWEPYWLPIGPHWKNTLVLGLVNTTGNTESTAFAGELGFNFKSGPSDLSLRVGGEYSITDGKPSAQRFYNDNIYKRSLPEWNMDRWLVFAESHNVYDGIKGISFRSQDAVGLGYKLWKGEKLEADLRAGPGVTCESFFDGTSHTDLSGLVGLRAQYTFNERANLTQDVVYTNGLTDLSRYQVSSETALNLKMPEIARGVGLRFLFRDDFDSTTRPPAKHNDTRLVIGVTYDF
ncbi:MAG: DUF481 domain-containing protein [Phycisphaerales bacterium]|nr:DUF481 domain-containing protein [Phycisphaerales bacterium]